MDKAGDIAQFLIATLRNHNGSFVLQAEFNEKALESIETIFEEVVRLRDRVAELERKINESDISGTH